MAKKNKLSKQAKVTKATKVTTVETKTVETPVVETEQETTTAKPEEVKTETISIETSKEQSKKPEEPKKTPKKEKVEEIRVEVVNPKEEINRNLTKIKKDERIDANRSIDMMCAIQKRYLTNNGEEHPEELKKAMGNQFDFMMYINLMRWNTQTINDFDEAGIIVNKEIFEQISTVVQQTFGITLKGLPEGNDGQMKIDFDASNKTTDKETQEAIKTEIKKKAITELPVYSEDMTDEQVIQAIDDIFGMRGEGMEANLYNAIEFARKAFKLEKQEPHKVLAYTLSKFDHMPLLIRGFEGIAYGSILANANPFIAHATMMNKLQKYKYTEKQVANLVRTFVSDQIERNIKTGGTFEERSVPIDNLMLAFNDKLINEILSSKEPIDAPKIKGFVYEKNEVLDRGKIVNSVEKAYGKLTDKALKKKLQEIAALYFTKLETIEALSK